MGDDHFYRGSFETWEIAFGGIGRQKAFKPAIIGLAHRGLYANLGRDTCADKLSDPPFGKLIAEVCGVEGTFAGFVDDGFIGQRGQRGDDLATTGRVE